MVSGLVVLLLPAFSQTAPSKAPLPESTEFLKAVETNFKKQFDEQALLEGYVYRVRAVEEELDDDNRVKKRVTTESEIYQFEQGPFRKLLRDNDRPLSAEEVQEQEADFSMHAEGEKIQKFDGPWLQSRTKSPEERGAFLQDVPQALDFELLRREMLNGRPAVVVKFSPRKDAPYSSRLGRLLLPNVAGLAWIDEEDLTVARVEAEIVADVNVGVFGLLAKISKGTVHIQEWLRSDDGKWLPWKRTMEFRARSFLVRGTHRRVAEERSDYRKFSVDTPADLFEGAP